MDSGDVVFATKLNGNESLLKTISEIAKVDGGVKLENKGQTLFDGKSKKNLKFYLKYYIKNRNMYAIYFELLYEFN